MSAKLHIPSWVFRYKLYHLPFWFGYHYLWWSIAVGNPLAAATSILFSPYTFKFLFYVVFQALGVYVNLYVLIPRFLEKGKYLSYLVSVLLTILVTACLIIPGYYMAAWWNEVPFHELFTIAENPFLTLLKNNSLPSTAASMTLAMSIKLGKNWLESRRRAQMLEKEKLETELKFLKSQFNPHFLFNTINSIFVLIHKNPDRASESLAKFSNLMRYQLYDCNAHQIPLDQELTYLEDFIELEELRQDHNFELELRLPPVDTSSYLIAPFLLMPFVENAFKHLSQNPREKNRITLHIDLQSGKLLFSISNSTSTTYQKTEDLLSYGGIGLKNVKRRLDLIYQDKYELHIDQQEDSYQVKLELTLQAVGSKQLIQ